VKSRESVPDVKGGTTECIVLPGGTHSSKGKRPSQEKVAQVHRVNKEKGEGPISTKKKKSAAQTPRLKERKAQTKTNSADRSLFRTVPPTKSHNNSKLKENREKPRKKIPHRQHKGRPAHTYARGFQNGRKTFALVPYHHRSEKATIFLLEFPGTKKKGYKHAQTDKVIKVAGRRDVAKKKKCPHRPALDMLLQSIDS